MFNRHLRSPFLSQIRTPQSKLGLQRWWGGKVNYLFSVVLNRKQASSPSRTGSLQVAASPLQSTFPLLRGRKEKHKYKMEASTSTVLRFERPTVKFLKKRWKQPGDYERCSQVTCLFQISYLTLALDWRGTVNLHGPGLWGTSGRHS